MTDETRAELRRLFTAMVRVAECAELSVEVIGTEPSSNPWARVSASCQVRESVARPGSAPELPPLTTAQQLAMSVLLGEPVPLAVLIGALEDAGMFADGVLQAVADKARAEERNGLADGIAQVISVVNRSKFTRKRTAQMLTNIGRNLVNPPQDD